MHAILGGVVVAFVAAAGQLWITVSKKALRLIVAAAATVGIWQVTNSYIGVGP